MTNADQPMWRRILLDERLPDGLLVQRMQLRELHMRAGYAPGAHIHNGPVFGTVAAGRVLFQVDGQPEYTLAPGDPFYEPAGAVIRKFDALDEDVTWIAHFPLREGQEPEITLAD